ncbi:RING/U-box superfamily protein [Striga hermonthica]|uniref:RING/U-box superfamily protein n=1 Tax=Striga hermonthica TaxID=68872 RepID=A0A9N7R3R4_STRHE|nr:RING/U-box superfamily protein [Striga hermonthica]
MAGTAVTQAPLPGLVPSGGGDCGVGALNNDLNPSELNDFRISVAIDRLNLHVRGQRQNDAQEFFNLCLSLARGIDVAIANHELPSRAHELPSLAKQVCQCKISTFTGAIMVFMISVKSACQRGWFPDKDSEELQNLAKQMADNFGSVSPLSSEPSCSHSVISTVMSRFYPKLKMGHVFVSLEVKPGFEAYLTDFQIPKNLKQTSPGDKILVVSVIQEFFVNASKICEVSKDSEIVEGPSRISLNCPISFTRIKTPVKGHSCKHMQCFDFDNYVGINSRRPSWRCPHCNQHVCFTDLRIDRKLVKVLKEAESDVSHITISPDGSWNPVMNSEDAAQKPEDKNLDAMEFQPTHSINAVDLTQTDDIMDCIATMETEDMKPSLIGSQNKSITPAISIEPHTATGNVNERNDSQAGDSFWTNVFLSTLDQPNIPSNIQIGSQFPNSPPVLTTSGQVTNFSDNNFLFTTSMPQVGPTTPREMPLQQYQFGNSNFTAEYGRMPSLPRNVTRVPTAVQALPAQVSSSARQQRSTRTSVFASSSPVASPHQVSSPMLRAQENRTFTQQQLGHPVTNQMANLRIPQTSRSQSPVGSIRSPIQSAATNFLQQQQSPVATAPSYSVNPNHLRAAPMADLGGNSAATSTPPLASTEDYNESWQPPVGRMRGALTGQAYTDAYNRFINQNQTNRVNRPSGGEDVFPNGSSGRR